MSTRARRRLRRRYYQTRILTPAQGRLAARLTNLHDYFGGIIGISGDDQTLATVNRHGHVRWPHPQRFYRRLARRTRYA